MRHLLTWALLCGACLSGCAGEYMPFCSREYALHLYMDASICSAYCAASGSYFMDADEDTSGSDTMDDDTSGSYTMAEDTSGSDTSGSYFMVADEDDTSGSDTAGSICSYQDGTDAVCGDDTDRSLVGANATAPVYSCDELMIWHNVYSVSDVTRIRGDTMSHHCYDTNTDDRWTEPDTLRYENVSECKDVCDRDASCIGFVDSDGWGNASSPKFCTFKAGTSSMEDDTNDHQRTEPAGWYKLVVSTDGGTTDGHNVWAGIEFSDVSGGLLTATAGPVSSQFGSPGAAQWTAESTLDGDSATCFFPANGSHATGSWHMYSLEAAWHEVEVDLLNTCGDTHNIVGLEVYSCTSNAEADCTVLVTALTIDGNAASTIDHVTPMDETRVFLKSGQRISMAVTASDCEHFFSGNKWSMYHARGLACAYRQGSPCTLRGATCSYRGVSLDQYQNQSACETGLTGFSFAPATAGECTVDATGIQAEADEECLDTKQACRVDPACNAVLQNITAEAQAGAELEELQALFESEFSVHSQFGALSALGALQPFGAFYQCLSDKHAAELAHAKSSQEGACDGLHNRRLNGTAEAQAFRLEGYLNDMRCSWSVVCETGFPLVRVHNLTLETGFDVVRAYDGAQRSSVCSSTGCHVGCNESMCLSSGVGVMGYEVRPFR